MHQDTRSVHRGRDPAGHSGTVNIPPHRASTILHTTVESLRDSRHTPPGEGITYGVHGTPGTFALEEALCSLEGGYRARLAPSGLAAISGPLLCFLSAGDHLLVVDSVYGPTRSFCNGMLRRLGVETEYYDPLVGSDIASLMRPNTRAVFMESPGSLTFEVQDVHAIAAAAREHGAVSILDNTWSTPLHFKPFENGVDLSIHAVTKYIAGHSDLVLGSVTANKESYPKLRQGWAELGMCVSPDDAFLALRGLRSMPARLAKHQEDGLRMAQWLLARDEVEAVLHPALPDDPGHSLWKRDFTGACGLFSFALRPDLSGEERVSRMMNGLQLFGMGYSWGGFESLLIPAEPASLRTATVWPKPDGPQGQLLRIHVGLEHFDDLACDLAKGFSRLVGD